MFSWKMIGVASAAIFFVLLLLHWGDKYGPNSQRLAAIVAAQAEKNGRLEQQAKHDAALHTAETADWSARETKFKAALDKLKGCPMKQADLDAINDLIGD